MNYDQVFEKVWEAILVDGDLFELAHTLQGTGWSAENYLAETVSRLVAEEAKFQSLDFLKIS
jgi:hypothetical protein